MNARQYAEGLERLKATNPANPLLQTLDRGFTPINAIYLKAQLQVLPVESEPNGAPKEPTDDSEVDLEETPDPIGDDLLRQMRWDLRRFFAERSALSNKFHELNTVEKRAENSEEIQILQRSIARLMGKIRHYKAYGSLPEEYQTRYYIPKDGLELAKLQNSLRAQISRKAKEIKAVRLQDESPQMLRKLETCENKLTDLKNNLENVQKAIADIQPIGF